MSNFSWNLIISLAKSLGGFLQGVTGEMPASGAYCLVINIEDKLTLKTGPFLGKKFATGVYLYAGRSLNGLPQRVARHAKKNKILHWHLDHLTSHPKCRVMKVIVFPKQAERECEIIRNCVDRFYATAPFPLFGASDCRELCPAHLLYLPFVR